jgi:biopolymer transport protein ExbD
MARQVQEINAGSMADIAFLLLIFFLMTTTMDIDSGITRKLPAPNQNQEENQEKIKERNVYIVLVNTYDQLFVEREVMDISQLRKGVKEFITNTSNNPNLSEKRDPEEIEGLGMVQISKGVVSLQNDRNTSYEKYIAVQNELVAAFNELRDEYSRAQFGMPFDDLDVERQTAIKKLYPQSISEAEPRNVGGN